MTRLSREIQEHYLLGLERDRLSNNEGELERLRTRAILARYLPPPPAVILDVGGGAGVHAFPLTEMRYNVHLIDPVELHLAQARSQSEKAGTKLASITLGNACCLAVAAGVIDAVLLLGPLYHLVERTERLGALREAYRVVKPAMDTAQFSIRPTASRAIWKPRRLHLCRCEPRRGALGFARH
jgi:ubiquinone/menaquinone biosynthesis C-methylase UbiE